MNTAYRVGRREAAVHASTGELVAMGRARVGRIVGGVVLACGALVGIGGATFTFTANGGLYGPEGTTPVVAKVLVLAWPAAVVAALAVRLALWGARVGADDDAVALERRLYALEMPSIAWPLAGVALAAPLTIHMLFACLKGDLSGFDAWMGLGGILVGHAHLGLAISGFVFANRLHRARTADAPSWRNGARNALSVAVGCAAIPGAILYLIPPVMVLVTGATFVPLAYWFVHRRFVREREAIRASLLREEAST